MVTNRGARESRTALGVVCGRLLVGSAALVMVLLFSGCGAAATRPPVDRTNPESVLRAYFKAWQTGDWEGERSFMTSDYATLAPEPATSLEIVSLRLVSSTPTHRTYAVVFNIQMGDGGTGSISSGRYGWTYELTLCRGSSSWLIDNYGSG